MQARLLEDCAHNLRIVYQLPMPVTESLLEAAGAFRVTVNRFSLFVAGAEDHIVASFDDQSTVRGEGVLGSCEFTVTYGSLHGTANPDAVGALEARLTHACAAVSS